MVTFHIWDPERGSDTVQIVELLNTRLSGRMQLPQFRWKHAENPSGRSLVLYAKNEAGNVVSVRSFMRWDLKWKGRTISGAQPCDTATAVEYERQGLFTKLTNEALTQLERAGVEVVFNFPQAGAMSGALRLGWKDMGGLTMFVSPLRYVSAALKGALMLESGVRRRDFLAPGRNSVDLPREGAVTLASDVVQGVRTSEVLEWRLANAPHRRYVTFRDGEDRYAFVLARVGRLRECTLMDVICPSGDWHNIGQRLRAVASRTGADILRVLLSRAHPLSAHLSSWTILERPSSANFVVLDLNDDATYSTKNWALTPFDIDTF